MRKLHVAAVWLSAFCLAGAGCEEQDGRADTIRWWTPPSWPEPTNEDIETVETIFGMEMIRHNGAVGATTVFLSDDASGGWGVGPTCSPHVSLPEGAPLVLAHEIGHTLGLEHVSVAGNLMSTSQVGMDLTDEQIDIARRGSWRIQECQ